MTAGPSPAALPMYRATVSIPLPPPGNCKEHSLWDTEAIGGVGCFS